MAFFWQRNFRFSNFCVLLNVWFYHIFCTYAFWIYALWVVFHFEKERPWIILTVYLCYLAFHLAQIIAVLFYSRSRWRDLLICSVLPLVPIYRLFQKVIRLISITEEILVRQSYRDPFYPRHVREATWHW